MNWVSIIFVVLALGLFETVSSVDNAIINAEVLSTMDQRSRRWFLSWGILLAVFAARGLLPFLVVWLATPGISPRDALTASFSSNLKVIEAISAAAPLLLMAGGVFLLFLFLHWLFLEPKKYGLAGERFFYSQGVWFYGVVSVLLCLIVWQTLKVNPFLAFAAVIGSTVFFITHGFKENAAAKERELVKGGLSAVSKIFYLEVIDATFSVDGVLGAFAFTLSVPLILLGNGLGAIVVRALTVKNVDRIKKYVFLKNGAMYSILFLAVIMVSEGFGFRVPQWVSPVVTFLIVGYFFLKSKARIKPEAR